MSLIFNGFKDRIQAEAFERAVKERFPERRTAIWMSYDEMAEACMARTPLAPLGWVGGIDQFVDSVDVLSYPAVARQLRGFIADSEQ